MSPGQIIDQIWTLQWYEVMHVAIMDDWILLVKMWPLFLAICTITAGVFFLPSFNQRVERKKKTDTCFRCKRSFYGEYSYLDDTPTEDTIIITDQVNMDFIISIHRSCAINWLSELKDVDRDGIKVETSSYIGMQLAVFIKEEFKDQVHFLGVRVNTHGKPKPPNKILST